ncbi:uncharacterized protein LOC112575379 [Pomacea canaliculata]|uniref:uncharacterized protein LOC112575379 n=1 Tax=Pomacea canaliculata TaxID=400727 RepID=UPI000D72BA9B|nr:uncharacterized protein LOC112575379 [Pomacea canaliculata]XP_025112990.1 uncharacterized protein LOC112575379 [Pomacea canaliculata]
MGDNATSENSRIDWDVGDEDLNPAVAIADNDDDEENATRLKGQHTRAKHACDAEDDVNAPDDDGVICKSSQCASSQSRSKQDAPSSRCRKPMPVSPGPQQCVSPSDSEISRIRARLGGDTSGLEEDEEVDKSRLMQYAEVLYKCALCTTLPCILTSKASFLSHVEEQHLNSPQHGEHAPKCSHCDLHFATTSDLTEHVACAHHDSSTDNDDSDDSCDSKLREKLVYSEKTEAEFHKQLSLKMEIDEREVDENSDSDEGGEAFLRRKSSLSRSEAKTPASDSLYRLQKLAEQILQSQVSKMEMPSGFALEGTVTLHPSFTPEFGRYTKLVREGGNIVYFCQVCNVKCQVKAAFHVHCNGIHHHNKVRIADKNSKDSAVSDNGCNHKASSLLTRSKEATAPPNQVVSRGTLLKVPLVPHCSERVTSAMDTALTFLPCNASMRGESESISTALRHDEIKSAAPPTRDVTAVRATSDSSDSDGSTIGADHKSAMSPDRGSLGHLHGNHRKRRKPYAPKAVRGERWRSLPADTRSCASPESLHSIQLVKDTVTASSDKENSGNSPRKVASSPPRGPQVHSPISIIHRDSVVTDDSHEVQKRVKLEYSDENVLLSDNIKTSPKIVERSHHVHSSDDEDPLDSAKAAVRKRKLLDSETEITNEAEECGEHAQSKHTIYPCPLCGFHADNSQLQEKHFLLVHNVNIGSDVSLSDSFGGQNNEGWKVMKIREVLSGLIEESARGSVSRDLLLQRVSLLLDCPQAVTWGPACNRAVREEHPHSVAQRKGKFKKTYFFGVSLIQRRGEEDDEEDVEEFESLTSRPLRDMTQDLEQILENLPSLLRWTGHVQKGVSRDEVLRALAELVGETEVQHWGVQCNRAVRMLFPHVEMKRKGKYKTTVYFGVGFTSDRQASDKVRDTTSPPPSDQSERTWTSPSGLSAIPSHAWAAYLLSFGHKLH